jgi:hypothetical protein
MNHQLFETWLHNPSELTQEQTNDLRSHLETCAECRRIHAGWTAAEKLIRVKPQMNAPEGFSARFQASLAERRVLKHRHQVRTVLLVMLGTILLSAILLAVHFFANNSPANVISRGIHFLTVAPQRFLEFRYIFSFWLGEIPVIYFIGAAFVLSSWIFILLVSWVLTISRIKHQGVTQS